MGRSAGLVPSGLSITSARAILGVVFSYVLRVRVQVRSQVFTPGAGR